MDHAILCFKCYKCARTEYIHAEQDPADDGYLIDESWGSVYGWLRVSMTATCTSFGLQATYCLECQPEVLAALGISEDKSLENMVQVSEGAPTPVPEEEEIPFYLLDKEGSS